MKRNGHLKRRNAKLGHVRVLALTTIRPSPENNQLYRPVDPDDPPERQIGVRFAPKLTPI